MTRDWAVAASVARTNRADAMAVRVLFIGGIFPRKARCCIGCHKSRCRFYFRLGSTATPPTPGFICFELLSGGHPPRRSLILMAVRVDLALSNTLAGIP